MSKPTIKLRDNIIVVTFSGPQTDKTVWSAVDGIQKLAQELKSKKLPVLLLADFDKVTSHNLAARKAGGEAFRELPFDRLSLYGGDIVLRGIVKLMAKVSGRENLAIFADRAEALRWLKK